MGKGDLHRSLNNCPAQLAKMASEGSVCFKHPNGDFKEKNRG
jgi:hypothetical protein